MNRLVCFAVAGMAACGEPRPPVAPAGPSQRSDPAPAARYREPVAPDEDYVSIDAVAGSLVDVRIATVDGRTRHRVIDLHTGRAIAMASLAATDLVCVDDHDQVATFFDPTVSTVVVAAYDGDHSSSGCTLRWIRLGDRRELARRTVPACAYSGNSPGFVTATGVVVIGNDVIDLTGDRARRFGADDPGTFYQLEDTGRADGEVVVLRMRRATAREAGWFDVATVDVRRFVAE